MRDNLRELGIKIEATPGTAETITASDLIVRTREEKTLAAVTELEERTQEIERLKNSMLTLMVNFLTSLSAFECRQCGKIGIDASRGKSRRFCGVNCKMKWHRHHKKLQ